MKRGWQSFREGLILARGYWRFEENGAVLKGERLDF